MNLCGDADSLGAVVGQLAGALWGASCIPQDWVARIEDWDGGSAAVRAYKLFFRRTFGVPAGLRQRFDRPEGAGDDGCDDDAAAATALWAELDEPPLAAVAEAKDVDASPVSGDV